MGKFQEIKRRNSKQSAGRRRPYCQGIFENLLRQENLTVNRFTLVETFFLEVNVEVDNFYQFYPSPPPPPPSRFLQTCVNISNLTCQDCLLINWLLIKRKGIYKILNPVSFVGRDAKCSCFIYSNMFQ